MRSRRMLSVGLAVVTLSVTLPTLGTATPAGAQNPAYPADTYIANVLSTGYAGGQGAILVRAINYYGLGAIAGMWNDPTWGVGLFIAYFDFCAASYAAQNPDRVGVELTGLVRSTANPAPHYATIDFSIGAPTTPTPPFKMTLDIDGEIERGAPMTAQAGYAFIGPVACGEVLPEEHTVNVSTVGSGTVDRDPDLASYPEGTQVELTADPDPGWSFNGWSGDISGSQNPATVTVNDDIDVTATFTEDPPEGPVIDVWYGTSQNFGSNGTVQRWLDVPGDVTDPDGVASLTYELNGGPAVPASRGPNQRRLLSAGDFVLDILVSELVTGPNSIEITATDSLGNPTQTTVTVNYQPAVPGLPVNLDWNAAEVNDVGHVIDGTWDTSSGELRTVEVGYDRLVGVGDQTMTDFEVTVPLTVHEFSSDPGPNSGDPAVGLFLRWNGHNDTVTPGSQPQQGWLPDGVNPTPFGAYALYRSRIGQTPRLELRDHRANVQDNESLTLTDGVTYLFKVRVETDSGTGNTTYSFKAWADFEPEPVPWTLEFTTGTDDDQPPSGSIVLVAHEADVSFGSVSIGPIAP